MNGTKREGVGSKAQLQEDVFSLKTGEKRNRLGEREKLSEKEDTSCSEYSVTECITCCTFHYCQDWTDKQNSVPALLELTASGREGLGGQTLVRLQHRCTLQTQREQSREPCESVCMGWQDRAGVRRWGELCWRGLHLSRLRSRGSFSTLVEQFGMANARGLQKPSWAK